MTQTSRVLRLLGLLQSRPTWTGPELADRLGVTTRTVRRDVDRLRALGYPVRAGQGVGGGYQLGSGVALPPLLLDDEEAVAVAVSLRLAAGGTVAGLGEPAMRTLGKLDQVLPARLRASVEAVSQSTVTLGRRDQLVEGAVVALLARAARECHEVRFGYAAASGAQSTRRAEPYRLVATTSRWYLLAWDLDREDWRSFRLDRMSEVRESTFTFRPREAPDAAEHVREALTRGPQGVDVVVDIDAPLDVVADAVPSGLGSLSAAGDRCELRFATWDLHSAAARLAWLPWGFRVVSPDALNDEVAALADRLGQAIVRR
ncbi:MAG: helix-turn-helix transcriptional regulator [Ornithinibacter sp.]